MKQIIYQVDAFTDEIFKGNPAAVCPLNSWLKDELMQKIAMENNLSETAFCVKKQERTIRSGGLHQQAAKPDLCGHATLAAAFILFNYKNHSGNKIRFKTLRSGDLIVVKEGDQLTLNFPADIIMPSEISKEIVNCFNIKPKQVFRGKTDYMFVFGFMTEVELLIPDLPLIKKLDCRGIIVTAPGEKVDFVSRFFGPQSGVDEDPATGSAHTTLTPYWSQRLGKESLTAIQLSARKGFLKCKNGGDRVDISGNCRLYMKGEIFI